MLIFSYPTWSVLTCYLFILFGGGLSSCVHQYLSGLFLSQYYYFIRLMGRKASHVALECALQSHPNLVCFFILCDLDWYYCREDDTFKV